MASNDEKASNLNNTPVSPVMEPKRKVSILTDVVPTNPQGYDNPAFDGPLRKISVVKKVQLC